MGIFLGNLQLKDVVKKEYLSKIQGFLDDNGYKKTGITDDVEKASGNYHIYDMPRTLVICDTRKVQEFYDFLIKNDLVTKAFEGNVNLGSLQLKK